MWRNQIPDDGTTELDNPINDFDALLQYMQQLADHKLGYPVSLLTYLGVVDNSVLGIEADSLANILLNNVGDPFKDSETSLMEVKKHERELISILEKYYGMKKDEARGYVTTGGTEGNFASLWWSKRYLINMKMDDLIKTDDVVKTLLKEEVDLTASLAKIPINHYEQRATQLQQLLNHKQSIAQQRDIVQELLTPTVFFSKGHTHYSVPKISEILRLNIRPVAANEDGSINLENLRRELILNLGAHPSSSIIVIANIGTTITGAIDDVPGIKKILDEMPSKPLYTIHLDGALTGFVMPVLKPFGDIKNYFSALGVNTLAVSAHKYPGLSQPCGIILAQRDFFHKAFDKSERSIDYVGNILDVTITGSRSGLNVLMFYNAIRTLELHKGMDRLSQLVNENLETAKYLYHKLVEIYGQERVSYPYHFNVIFPRTSLVLAKKYQLMLTGDHATICVLTNVTKRLIDEFIEDLRSEVYSEPQSNVRRETMSKTTNPTMTKSGYTVKPLSNEHMLSAAELFTRSFCDSEPITRHLGVQYHEYEPFVMDVIQKAVKDGLSVVAVDRNNSVVACAIAEDITDMFEPKLANYPKLKPVFALLDELSKPFLTGKKFIKGHIAHVWIAIVDQQHRGKGLSTDIDLACGVLCASKGYRFAYAEFTNPVSEKIAHHFTVNKLCNTIKYDTFKWSGAHPFKGVKGEATAHIVGLTPEATLKSLEACYTVESK